MARLPGHGPRPPLRAAPPGLAAAAARGLFITCYDLLGPLAARRVRQIIARYSPDLAGRAAYHGSQLTLADPDA